MNKVIPIVGGVAVASIITCGALIILQKPEHEEQKRRDSLTASISEYMELTDCKTDSDVDINELLIEKRDELVADEDYINLEAAVKNYLYDTYAPYCKAESLREEDIYKSGVSIGLIASEQPDFDKSLADLSQMIQSLDLLQDAINNNFEEESALSYLDAEMREDLKYVELFKTYTKSTYEDTKLQADLQNYVTNTRNASSKLLSVLSFLVYNKNGWSVATGELIFNTTMLKNQYDALIAQ